MRRGGVRDNRLSDAEIQYDLSSSSIEEFASHLHCRGCQYDNDIVMKFKFDVEETHQQETLCAIIPFDRIRKHRTLFGSFHTIP